jgi:hypothetical protein
MRPGQSVRDLLPPPLSHVAPCRWIPKLMRNHTLEAPLPTVRPCTPALKHSSAPRISTTVSLTRAIVDWGKLGDLTLLMLMLVAVGVAQKSKIGTRRQPSGKRSREFVLAQPLIPRF